MVYHRERRRPGILQLLWLCILIGTDCIAAYSASTGSKIDASNEENPDDWEWCVQQSHDIFSHAVDAVYGHFETIHGSSADDDGPSIREKENGEIEIDNETTETEVVPSELTPERKLPGISRKKTGRLIRLWRKRKSLKGMGIVKKCLGRKHQRRLFRSSEMLSKLPDSEFRNATKQTKNHKVGKLRRVWNGVKKMVTAGALTSTSSMELKKHKKIPVKDEKGKSNLKRKAFEGFRYYSSKFEHEETVAGTKLLSGSFQVLSRTAGYVADTVRISGDTAAGIMGSSVKMLGTAVKSVGTGLSSASRRLDKTNSSDGSSEHDNYSSSAQISDESHRPSWRHRSKKKYGNLGRHTRRVAAKSVKLVGSVIGGVGESLLIAGVAAEALTSSTAGVAEDTVRILENLAGTISVAISLKSRHTRRTKASNSTQDSGILRKKLSPYFVSFGTYENGTRKNDTLLVDEKPIADFLELMDHLTMDAVNFWTFVSADTVEVPSMAVELLIALILCYLFTILLLPRQGTGGVEKRYSQKNQPKFFMQSFRWGLLPIASLRGGRSDNAAKTKRGESRRHILVKGCVLITSKIVLLPFRALKFSLKTLFRFIFNRKVLLLAVYALIWVYLATLSQERALLIQRRGEAIGFRSGIASFTENSPASETVVWLNQLLGRLWRVKRDEGGESSHEASMYPIYVLRAFQERSSHENYGGLEPQLSSWIGKGIVKGLEAAKTLRPSDIAYVSLFSLSLGSRAPIIRNVELSDNQTTFTGNRTRVELNLDIDALFEDLSLVLEVKLSTLAYAILPSTKIKVYNLDFRTSIRAVLLLEPDYPFVSNIELSMLRQPDCNLRVTPLGHDSGLRGVDLGSLPFLKDWIKDAIQSSLSNYVAPHYITIDLAAALSSDKSFVAPVSPYIETLRQKTRFSLANPRTSISDGIAITSVADRLESHQSSIQVLRPEIEPQQGSRHWKRKQTNLKPVTELSRRALDRYALKEGNRIKPTTELSKIAMDRWLDSELLAELEEKR